MINVVGWLLCSIKEGEVRSNTAEEVGLESIVNSLIVKGQHGPFVGEGSEEWRVLGSILGSIRVREVRVAVCIVTRLKGNKEAKPR